MHHLPALSLFLCLASALACSSKKAPGSDAGAAGNGGSDTGGGGNGAGGALAAIQLVNPTETQMLSGHGSDDAVPWDFYCASSRANNRNCTNAPGNGIWTTIPVPSNWELQGFGTYYYGTDNGFQRGPVETGFYRRSFDVPPTWRGRRVSIVFEGSMTDTDVKINGMSAGPTHQGAFYRFRYDVSSLLTFDAPNLLEVTVADESSNVSVSSAERSADYWVFGGIFRPVYLEAAPAQAIDHVGIDARADGTLSVNVALQAYSPTRTAHGARLRRRRADGRRGADDRRQRGTGRGAAHRCHRRYQDLERGDAGAVPGGRLAGARGTAGSSGGRDRGVSHRRGPRRDRSLFVNGKQILLRGVNRHSFWPSTGRATTAALSHDDVALIKAMNGNAVRSSHYPPDRHFLDAADAQGLYVLDELAGWQHAYDTAAGTALLQEMVAFDANHPSIIFWDNGNEGGWNTALDGLFGQLDPQHRIRAASAATDERHPGHPLSELRRGPGGVGGIEHLHADGVPARPLRWRWRRRAG